MKYLLAGFILLLAATSAFASKPDSGICPWKMPFTIQIDGMGKTQSFENSNYYDTDYDPQPATQPFTLTIDTTSSYLSDSVQYSLINNVLRFSTMRPVSNLWLIPSYSTVEIYFVHGQDSIIMLKFYSTDSFQGGGNSFYNHCSFQISALAFNDSSIFSSDSFFSGHNISFTYYYETGDSATPYDFDEKDYAFTASSVTLSGIFRTTTFSDPPSIVTEAPAPNNLAVYSANGSAACSFEVAAQERNLDVYSVLGMKVTSVAIPPNESQASLPHLLPGFYFVRLEENVRKVYVPD